MNEINLNLDKISSLISQGQLNTAKKMILEIQAKDIYKPDLVFYCSLLRRLRLISNAIQLLQPLVYPKSRSTDVATEEEKLEYASCLVRVGAESEAERLLNSISEVNLPIVLIRKSSLCITQWNYEKSNKHLLDFIKHPQADEYNIYIAKVNLLQGYVVLEKIDEAQKLFIELESDEKFQKYKFLLAAVYEFGAEICRLQKKLKKGLDYIQKAFKLIDNKKSVDYFLIRKQKWILESYLNFSNDTFKEYKKLKKEASLHSNHESLRDLDFHWSIITKNIRLLNRVYWQTHSEFYKKRILNYSTHLELPLNTDSFSSPKPHKLKFDMNHGIILNSKTPLKPNQALSRLLKYLFSEKYKPISLIDIFDKVYPDETYIPEYSDTKVHQLLKRLRQFLTSSQTEIKLICKNDKYELDFKNKLTLIHADQYADSFYQDLYNHFKLRRFQIREASALWNCSDRTAMRRLKKLKAHGSLQVKGQTRAAYFKLNKALSSYYC